MIASQLQHIFLIYYLIKIAKRSPIISKLQANKLYSKKISDIKFSIIIILLSLDKIRMIYLLTPYSFVFFSFPFSFAHQMFSLSWLKNQFCVLASLFYVRCFFLIHILPEPNLTCNLSALPLQKDPDFDVAKWYKKPMGTN